MENTSSRGGRFQAEQGGRPHWDWTKAQRGTEMSQANDETFEGQILAKALMKWCGMSKTKTKTKNPATKQNNPKQKIGKNKPARKSLWLERRILRGKEY